MNTILYNVDNNGRLRQWSITVEGNGYQTTSGLVDGEKIVSAWTYVEGKNTGRANATTAPEQALREAESFVRQRIEHGWKTSPEDALNEAKNSETFKPMLANKWKDVEKKIFCDSVHPLYIQPKLDGCRCIVKRDGMFARSGKRWISAPHIFEGLLPVFEKYPDAIFDGELYFHSHEDNFNEVISIVKKTKPTEEDLRLSAEKVQYWIYDFPGCRGTFKERNQMLNNIWSEFPEIFNTSPSNYINVDTYIVKSKDEIQGWLEKFVSDDYEGAIVRLDTLYENKRTNSLLKVKQFHDEEFTILDIEEGKGKFYGHAGRIIVDVDGKRVSTGLVFSHEEMREIWENREYYIGKKATVKYFNKTVDGSLRFPKVIQIDRESYE